MIEGPVTPEAGVLRFSMKFVSRKPSNRLAVMIGVLPLWWTVRTVETPQSRACMMAAVLRAVARPRRR